jgi:hypothetical protein
MRQTKTEPPGRGAMLREGRRRRLIAAGFDPQLAGELTADEAVDLHELLVLRDRGCPPAVAARILAPIDATAPRR